MEARKKEVMSRIIELSEGYLTITEKDAEAIYTNIMRLHSGKVITDDIITEEVDAFYNS